MVSKCTCTKVREDKAGVWQGQAWPTAKFLDQVPFFWGGEAEETYSLTMPNPYFLFKKCHYKIIHFLRIWWPAPLLFTLAKSRSTVTRIPFPFLANSYGRSKDTHHLMAYVLNENEVKTLAASTLYLGELRSGTSDPDLHHKCTSLQQRSVSVRNAKSVTVHFRHSFYAFLSINKTCMRKHKAM